MKYIKAFEDNYVRKFFYNTGDVVILKDLDPNIGIIIDINRLGEFESSYVYHIELYNNKEISVGRSKIQSFATPEEIKEFETKRKIDKFNL